MRSHVIAFALFAASFAAAPAAAFAAESTHDHAAAPSAKGAKSGDAKLIASAMSAAPAAISRHASVVTMAADGSMKTLRKGTNGFTCMPDDPSTPGPDPMCGDQNAMEWVMAWASHKPPPHKVGLLYMLAGGTDFSNTDPFATKPMAGNHWIKTGPHVMIVGDPDMLKNYPTSADPDTSQPYVMWAGTPYAHLMAPVR
jgi:hypothetical protein